MIRAYDAALSIYIEREEFNPRNSDLAANGIHSSCRVSIMAYVDLLRRSKAASCFSDAAEIADQEVVDGFVFTRCIIHSFHSQAL